jgi:outer membrane protein insertion porin family
MRATDRYTLATARIVAVLVGIVLCAAAGLAQDTLSPHRLIVGDVNVRNNRRMSTQELMGMLRTRVGSEYNPAVIQEDVRTLYGTRQFGNVVPRKEDMPGGKVRITFFVSDVPNVVKEVVYENAHSLKVSELESLTNVKKGAPLNTVANKVACQSIVNRLREKGRLFASCTLKEGGKPGDTRVVFNITEGPQVYIRDIDFVGNHFVSGAVLKTHINSSERLLGINLFSRPYIPALMDNDLRDLIEYYKSFGYLDVRVSREVRWNPGSKTVDVIFHIDEGLQYHVQGPPQVLGSKSFKEVELARNCQVRADEAYNQQKVTADAKRIEAYIGYHGYPVGVQDGVVFTGPGLCQVQYQVQERPPTKVGQIFIVGNTTTKQNVILRQVPLYPGQPLSYPNLKQAEANLARLGIFESNPAAGVRPTVNVLDPESDSPYKDILINVQEARTGSLLFGVGFNSNAGATGSVVLNERNFDIFRWPTSFDDLFSGTAFRGAGQELRLEAVPGTQLQRYTFQFREPYLFDSQYGLNVSGYYYTRIYNEYDEQRTGSRVGISRRFGRFWTGDVTARVENIAGRNIPFYAPIDYQQVQGNNFLTSLRLGITRDSRDSYLRATDGSVFNVSIEQATGDYTFPIFNADFDRFWTVFQRPDGSGRHVVAFHSQVGYAGQNTPVFERFFAGGFRSLRGFQFRGVSPDVNGFKVGGDFLLLNSLEYQLPVNAGDNFFLVAFCDSGTVERDIEIKNYRVTAGFGVRFTVPMLGPVPIALDFGFPIVKAPNDRTQVFSFWMGFFR